MSCIVSELAKYDFPTRINILHDDMKRLIANPQETSTPVDDLKDMMVFVTILKRQITSVTQLGSNGSEMLDHIVRTVYGY